MPMPDIVPIDEQFARLAEKLNPREQQVLVDLMQTMIANRTQEKPTPSGSEKNDGRLWTQGIDAQDYVDELRGKRCG